MLQRYAGQFLFILHETTSLFSDNSRREWRSYVPLAAPVMKADPFSRGRIATVTDLVKALQGPGSECFVVSFGSRQTD
jgi:hypothetical protein